VPITMDDGIALRADIYTPYRPDPHPTILVRSPYGRRGPYGLLLGRVFAERGYRVVVQSCRGTGGSEGAFHPYFDERADGLATIRWIEQQVWFDGRLALNGPSYLGGVQWAVADDSGPVLRALCTHVTFSNIARHWYAGGSFSLQDSVSWTSMVCRPGNVIQGVPGTFRRRTPWALRVATRRLPLTDLDRLVFGTAVPFWQEFISHPAVEDPFWAPINHSARVAQVSAPVLQVSGWFDLFLPIQLDDHRALVEAGTKVRLVVGPWTHTAARGFATQVTESLRWLDRYVRDFQTSGDQETSVRLFVMGGGGWNDFESWPPTGYSPQHLFLHRGGTLTPKAPISEGGETYRYDPRTPTPVIGGSLLGLGGGRKDQRRRERRSDVLVFTSDTLTGDIDVIGEVVAEIHVTCDIEDFDIFVRLCDVDRRGRSHNVCDGIERVSPIRSPRPSEGRWLVRVRLWPTAYRFRSGHHIRVQVSSGAHPRFARNLGTGDPLATGTRTRVAQLGVLLSPANPSSLIVPVANASLNSLRTLAVGPARDHPAHSVA